MRKSWYATVLAVATTLLAAAALLTAMSGTAFASSVVLTYDSLGGTEVAVNDVLHAHNVGATTLYTTSGSGLRCSTSHASVTVTSNPTAPGVASGSVDALSFATCVADHLTGVTCVKSVTINNLPYNVTAASDLTVTVAPRVGTSIQTTVVLCTLLGTITCVYQAHNMSLIGVYSNVDSTVTFTNQPFDRTSGPSACPTPVYYSAKYHVTDATHTRPVFVN